MIFLSSFFVFCSCFGCHFLSFLLFSQFRVYFVSCFVLRSSRWLSLSPFNTFIYIIFSLGFLGRKYLIFQLFVFYTCHIFHFFFEFIDAEVSQGLNKLNYAYQARARNTTNWYTNSAVTCGRISRLYFFSPNHPIFPNVLLFVDFHCNHFYFKLFFSLGLSSYSPGCCEPPYCRSFLAQFNLKTFCILFMRARHFDAAVKWRNLCFTQRIVNLKVLS